VDGQRKAGASPGLFRRDDEPRVPCSKHLPLHGDQRVKNAENLFSFFRMRCHGGRGETRKRMKFAAGAGGPSRSRRPQTEGEKRGDGRVSFLTWPAEPILACKDLCAQVRARRTPRTRYLRQGRERMRFASACRGYHGKCLREDGGNLHTRNSIAGNRLRAAEPRI